MTPCLSNKGHEVITILRYVHGAKTIKLYSAGRGGGMSKNLVQGPTVIDSLLKARPCPFIQILS